MRRVFRSTVAAGMLAALLTGCGSEPGETITVTSPAPGEAVSVPFEVTFDTSVALGPPHEGLHHVHIWFGDDVAAQVIGESTVIQINNAPDGEHEMHVSLRYADHSAAGADTSVRIVVSGGAVG